MNRILFGDCIEQMQTLPDGAAQMCVTSPPYYGLRDYGVPGQIGLEDSPEEFIARLVDVFREVKRLLSDDGVLWLNIGDSYYNYRTGKGQSMPKQTVSSTSQDLPTSNARRGNKLHGLKEKDLIGIPWMLAFALRADGWYLRQDIIWHKPNPMPESVRDRCTKAHEYVFLLSKSDRYFFESDAMKEPASQNRWGGKKAMNTKNSKDSDGVFSGLTRERDMMPETRSRRSVWTVPTRPYKGAHFATFPTALIEPCVLAGSRVGDVVFDPFMGSGTTAAVAIQHGRQYLGCELNSDYEPLQAQRISDALRYVEIATRADSQLPLPLEAA